MRLGIRYQRHQFAAQRNKIGEQCPRTRCGAGFDRWARAAWHGYSRTSHTGPSIALAILFHHQSGGVFAKAVEIPAAIMSRSESRISAGLSGTCRAKTRLWHFSYSSLLTESGGGLRGRFTGRDAEMLWSGRHHRRTRSLPK